MPYIVAMLLYAPNAAFLFLTRSTFNRRIQKLLPKSDNNEVKMERKPQRASESQLNVQHWFNVSLYTFKIFKITLV